MRRRARPIIPSNGVWDAVRRMSSAVRDLKSGSGLEIHPRQQDMFKRTLTRKRHAITTIYK